MEVERTGMAKSYKMIVLEYMLTRGQDEWYKPVMPEEVAPFFHQYLTEKEYRKRIDFSDKASRRLWDYDEKKVASLIASMPMSKWSGSLKGLIEFQGRTFSINITFAEMFREIIYEWTKQICNYRLHYHFEKREKVTILK